PPQLFEYLGEAGRAAVGRVEARAPLVLELDGDAALRPPQNLGGGAFERRADLDDCGDEGGGIRHGKSSFVEGGCVRGFRAVTACDGRKHTPAAAKGTPISPRRAPLLGRPNPANGQSPAAIPPTRTNAWSFGGDLN